MKKLVTALIIVLPLILVIALFAVTSFTRLAANIAVTGIVINNRGEDGTFYLDIADYGDDNSLKESDLGVEVTPKVATNKKYSRKITSEDGRTIVTCDANGRFIPCDIGKARVTYTSVDGGFEASVMLVVTASDVIRFEPTVTDLNGKTFSVETGTDSDYEVDLTSGTYTLGAKKYPDIVTSYTNFVSDNEIAVSINNLDGRFDARLSGRTTITMSVGKAETKTIALNVKRAGDVTVNGIDVTRRANEKLPEFAAPLNSDKITLFVETDASVKAEEILLEHPDIASCNVTPINEKPGAFRLDVMLVEAKDSPSYDVRFHMNVSGQIYELSFNFNDYSFFVHSPANPFGSSELIMLEEETTSFAISSAPLAPSIPDGMTFEWILDGECAAIDSVSNEQVNIKAIASGVATLTATWSYNGKSDSVTNVLRVVKGYSSLIFGETSDTYGLGKLAVASKTFDENTIPQDAKYKSKFVAKTKNGSTAELNDENLEFVTSDATYATVVTEGSKVYFDIHATGEVTVTASWKYGDRYGVQPTTVTFDAVDGVQIGVEGASKADTTKAYEQLRYASAHQLNAVLAQDVYLGECLYEQNDDLSYKMVDGARQKKYSESEMGQKLKSFSGELATTWDWTYYKNMGKSHPSVRYALEFTADVYGNGHVISGEYITNHIDNTGHLYDYALFKGPLDFVSAKAIAAVKGQDNIVFLVRTDGVTLDNVVLTGCDDASLIDGNEIDLNILKYMGTTLEVMCDATMRNCRVRNGRTVMRAFGRDNVDREAAVNPDAERIRVMLDRCHLQNAREFLLKVGTNRYINGTFANPEPSLYDANAREYDNYNNALCDEYLNDEYFMHNFVLTDLTLKDSLLQTSGLFSVGMESHFAGTMLADISKDDKFGNIGSRVAPEWHDLAATSYPAALRLVGKVCLADWKNIDSVKSDTLIEVADGKEGDVGATLGSIISLDIAAMLREVYSQKKNSGFGDIITEVGDATYAHGGIAFYGGGKNYSVLDLSQYTFAKMNTYHVNLSILSSSEDPNMHTQGDALPHAAGKEDFRFVMFGSNSDFKYNTEYGDFFAK